MHALAARGWQLHGLTSDTALAAYLALPGQRSFDLADLALRYTQRELRDAAAPASGQLTLELAEQDEDPNAAARRPGPARAGDRRAGRRARRGPGQARRRASCSPTSSCRWSACWPRWSRPASRADVRPLRGACRPELGGEVKAAEQGAYAATGHEFNLGSPKQLQEVLFTELGLPKTKRIKTGYTTDSEALTGLLGADRAPGARAPAAAPRRGQAEEHRGLADPDGRRGRPDPHHLQPDDRGHRPALLDRPEPAEHPDPHRGGPARSGRASWSARATSAC